MRTHTIQYLPTICGAGETQLTQFLDNEEEEEPPIVLVEGGAAEAEAMQVMKVCL